MNEPKGQLYPYQCVDECIPITPGLPKELPVTRVYSCTSVESMTFDEFKSLAESSKSETPKQVRTAAQIASNVVAKRRAKNKAAKMARKRNSQ